MASNLNFDYALLAEALKISGFKYKKDVVNQALKEFINRRKQLNILKFFNSVDYEEGYDYKKGRENRCT